MTCLEAEPLLNAYLDGELDLPGSLDVERHLAACRGCAAQYTCMQRLREEIAVADLRYRPGPGLERRIRPRRSLTPWPGMSLLAATAAMAALLVVVLISRTQVGPSGEGREMLDSHLRSLMPNHLVDVPSSDQHTVKPWFQGKTTFSPPVPDLGGSGFSLIGGRLEVIRRRPAAAIVYQRRQHIVSLYVAPSEDSPTPPSTETIDGYHLVRWTSNGLSYSAVSDLNPGELRTFADLVRAR